jgi:uncharacterized RDD family membrane protein YckC
MQLSFFFIAVFSFFVFDKLSGNYINKPFLNIAILCFPLIIFIVINLILLYHYGQTIGKRLLSIKIVRSNGSRARACHQLRI